MNIAVVASAALLAAMLWPAAGRPLQMGPPTETGPLRNTFVTAAETVIDDASAVDVKADDAHFDGQMQTLKSAKGNLESMADGDREKDVVASMNDLIFLIAACHIQAKDGADPAKCEAGIDTARNRSMELIGKHKAGGAWADGAPRTVKRLRADDPTR